MRFTCTSTRQKYRNVEANPEVAFSIADPEDVFRYLEVRGRVEKIEPDPEGAFFLELSARHAGPFTEPPADSPKRVVFVVRPTAVSCQ